MMMMKKRKKMKSIINNNKKIRKSLSLKYQSSGNLSLNRNPMREEKVTTLVGTNNVSRYQKN